VRETNYDLQHLTEMQLKEKRDPYDEEMLPMFYMSGSRLMDLMMHTEKDSYFTFALLLHLNIIPLTKQLTTIAGNLWFRSLQNARAERNEMLLLHEFHAKKFVCPDKKAPSAKDIKKGL
jgi:DNA polymerase alpha subunit A